MNEGSIEFLVQGSEIDPYRVSFHKSGNNLSAYCTCAAGSNGQYCKHRFNILDGIIDGVVSGNETDVITVGRWLEGSDVEAALHRVRAAETEVAEAKVRLSAAKKALAAAMRD